MANLTHHERLRYEYLLQNIGYLGAKERAEFDYLEQKRRGQWQTVQVPQREVPIPSAKPQKIKVNKIRKKGKIKRFFRLVFLLFLGLLATLLFLFFKGQKIATDQANSNHKPAIIEKFNGKKTKDGTNILILGTDQRVTERSSDARADTIMVVNIGGKDGKIKMVSFMRDILVNIEGASYSDYSYDHKLNASFTIGEQNKNQGAELVRQTLKRNFDIDIQYYAMVDFETFALAVDTLFPKGVKIDAKFATVDGQTVKSVKVPDDLNLKDGVLPMQTIKVGQQYMDGRTLLNYARFRKDDEGDFGRTKRQQQVMQAVMSQLKNPTSLFTGSEALGKIFALTSTNIPYTFILQNGLSIVSSGKDGIERITLPDNSDWEEDYDMYGGQGLWIDLESYQKRLTKLGLR